MKLAKALKQKNVLIKEIVELQKRFQTYNSVIEGTEVPYPATVSLMSLSAKQKELVDLKMKIYKANMPIQERIFKISEIKTIIATLRSVSTNNGVVKTTPRYGGETSTDKYIASYTLLDIDGMIKGYEELIDTLQEEIDTHNHNTEI